MTDRTIILSRRGFVTGCAALAATPALAAPPVLRGAAATETITGSAFATGWRVVLPSGPRPDLVAPIAALLAGIDAEMSPWRDDSAISSVNAMAPGVRGVSEEFAQVLAAAQALQVASGGTFDPRVGPAVAQWGFGPIHAAPGAGAFALEGGRLEKSGTATLDLCGIAKGRALDRVAGLLRAGGEGDFLIEIGGELMANGQHPDSRPWRIGVEDPRPGVAGLERGIDLVDRAIATSGLKTQSYMLNGQVYGHIIDPHDMRPVAAGPLASVSVMADSAMMADGWATALMAAGPEDGPRLAETHRIDALFLYSEPNGLRAVTTGGMG
ncbi:FAD:protein FMN transferase [Pseudooceanicola sp. LIPI14-2-Ac024]|uniref:FAD:protein FMN transferase n=1 Tax=Pseudooceanicola sp. LIPI14-2-Ac024 TaxID=3344875 RepID=UPI0035D139DB